jgi:hypothetical protein
MNLWYCFCCYFSILNLLNHSAPPTPATPPPPINCLFQGKKEVLHLELSEGRAFAEGGNTMNFFTVPYQEVLVVFYFPTT